MKIYLLILLATSNVFASTSQTFVCDMRNLVVNDTTTGGLKLEVSPNDVVLSAGVFGNTEVATLSRTSSTSKSSTVFLHEDEKGRIEQSFDLMPSGEVGVLIWRNYGWREPDSRIPVNMSVHVCKAMTQI